MQWEPPLRQDVALLTAEQHSALHVLVTDGAHARLCTGSFPSRSQLKATSGIWMGRSGQCLEPSSCVLRCQ